jgi:hypothetical protein
MFTSSERLSGCMILAVLVTILLVSIACPSSANIFRKLSKIFTGSPIVGSYYHDHAGPTRFNHRRDVLRYGAYGPYPGPMSADYGFLDGYHNERVHRLYTYYRRRRR